MIEILFYNMREGRVKLEYFASQVIGKIDQRNTLFDQMWLPQVT